MARWMLLLTAMFLILASVMGCGDDDDDCPTCPEASVQPLGFTQGSLYLDPEAYMDYLWVFGMGAMPPNIDSVKVGDSLVNRDDFDYTYDEDYHETYWEIYFSENGSASTYMWDHGDIATVSVWGEGRSSTCALKILDPDSAEAYITSPLMNVDTILPTASDTVYWNEVDDADYYAILIEVRQSINGNTTWYYSVDYTLDTAFIVTPATLEDSTQYFYINVTPFTGPDPRTGETNWTGTLLGGRLFSFGWDDYTRIYIRQTAVGKANTDADLSEEGRREWKPNEIVNELYNRMK